jgi:ribosome-associated toxin RatA of RatAB toxin-antitoxin module
MITALFTTSLPPNMHMHTARDLGRAYSAAIAIAIAASGTRTRTAATTTRLTTTQHRHHRKHATTTATATTTQSHEVRSRHLQGVHPLHLFRIVQDVDRYQEFLPLCSSSRVFRETIADGGRSFEAELVVGFGFGSLFQTQYNSTVTVDPRLLTIETRSGTSVLANNNNSNDGSMFDSLTSFWKLRPIVESDGDGDSTASLASSLKSSSSDIGTRIGTSVDFRVEMTVSDPVVVAVLNQVLYNVAESQVEAFHERCRVLPPPTPEELFAAERFYKTTTE